MSAYEQLCNVYLQSRERLETCRETCATQFAEVLQHLIKRLEIPEQAVRYMNLNDRDGRTTYTVPGAITLGPDGFWHLGFIIIFHKEGTAPAFQLLFDIHLKEHNQGFLVKLSEEDPGIILHSGSQTDFDRFADAFVERVHSWFDSYVERVLDSEENVYEGHGTYL